jgi:DNA gyrase subunit A
MAYSQIRQTGIIGVVIDEGDELIGANILNPGDDIFLGTKHGQSIRFSGDNQVRATARQSRGVRGIEIRKANTPDDEVVKMAVVSPQSEETLLTISENGYGKRTSFEEYRSQHRGGSGLKTVKMTEKTGKVTAILPVEENEHLMLITSGGKIIRIAAATVSVLSRNTQGVRLIRMNDGETVIGVERLAEDEQEEEANTSETPEQTPDTSQAQADSPAEENSSADSENNSADSENSSTDSEDNS